MLTDANSHQRAALLAHRWDELTAALELATDPERAILLDELATVEAEAAALIDAEHPMEALTT